MFNSAKAIIMAAIDYYEETGNLLEELEHFDVVICNQCIIDFTKEPRAEELLSPLIELVILQRSKAREEDKWIRQRLDRDFNKLYKSLYSYQTRFKLPTVAAKYRENISPVLAMFYELKGVDITNIKEHWLGNELLNNDGFLSEIITSIKLDIENVSALIDEYSEAYKKFYQLGITEPLRLIHVRRLLDELNVQYDFFTSIAYLNRRK